MSELEKKMQALEEAIGRIRKIQTYTDAICTLFTWDWKAWKETHGHDLQITVESLNARNRELEKEIEELLEEVKK